MEKVVAENVTEDSFTWTCPLCSTIHEINSSPVYGVSEICDWCGIDVEIQEAL